MPDYCELVASWASPRALVADLRPRVAELDHQLGSSSRNSPNSSSSDGLITSAQKPLRRTSGRYWTSAAAWVDGPSTASNRLCAGTGVYAPKDLLVGGSCDEGPLGRQAAGPRDPSLRDDGRSAGGRLGGYVGRCGPGGQEHRCYGCRRCLAQCGCARLLRVGTR